MKSYLQSTVQLLLVTKCVYVFSYSLGFEKRGVHKCVLLQQFCFLFGNMYCKYLLLYLSFIFIVFSGFFVVLVVLVCILHHIAVAINSFITTIFSLLLLLLLFIAFQFFLIFFVAFQQNYLNGNMHKLVFVFIAPLYVPIFNGPGIYFTFVWKILHQNVTYFCLLFLQFRRRAAKKYLKFKLN